MKNLMKNGENENLAGYLEKNGVELFAACPADKCTITKEYLMNEKWRAGHAVFVLVPYFTPVPAGSYKMSAYARVKDYHSYMKELLGTASDYLSKKYPGSVNGAFSDHSPVNERLGAACAGLGVLGRNGLLITEKYSSYVFIGEIMTTLGKAELSREGIDSVCDDVKRCIGCKRCVTCCPGGCMEDDRGSCVSALTQKKGELTQDEMKLIIKCESIWGCDTCQEVCPYTAAALAKGTIYTNISYFKDSVLEVNDNTIENMSDEEFEAYPFSWRKKEIILRNISLIRESHSNPNKRGNS